MLGEDESIKIDIFFHSIRMLGGLTRPLLKYDWLWTVDSVDWQNCRLLFQKDFKISMRIQVKATFTYPSLEEVQCNEICAWFSCYCFCERLLVDLIIR